MRWGGSIWTQGLHGTIENVGRHGTIENDRELRMVAHWFAEEMTRARISTVWDKWPQA